MDKYQEKYIAHQKRKSEVLAKLLKDRHSTRVYDTREVHDIVIKEIVVDLEYAPSSCDRHGVYTKTVTERDEKAILGGMLVGGVGWVHRAPTILLLFADPQAYKEGLIYMPYLDAGVALYHLWLTAENKGLKGAYVNPNVRPDNQLQFRHRFGYDIFCGALALGYEEKK